MDYYKLKLDQILNTKNINKLPNNYLLADLIALIWIESELQSDYPNEFVENNIDLEETLSLQFKYKEEILKKMK
ncbi:MAG: hypothetical protein LBR24_02850 [Methanobrevibacter sp.]|nr:hypothetical protein [Methanobrevibacter sp.]